MDPCFACGTSNELHDLCRRCDMEQQAEFDAISDAIAEETSE